MNGPLGAIFGKILHFHRQLFLICLETVPNNPKRSNKIVKLNLEGEFWAPLVESNGNLSLFYVGGHFEFWEPFWIIFGLFYKQN